MDEKPKKIHGLWIEKHVTRLLISKRSAVLVENYWIFTCLTMPSCERAPTDAFITSKGVLTSDSVVDAWVVEAFINICEKRNIFLPLLPLSIASCGLYISYLFSIFLQQKLER